jgi:hypothetical protein
MIWNPKVCARTQDTRFIQVWAARCVIPYVLFGVLYHTLHLGVVSRRDCGCSARYPALLYIVQKAGS